MAQSPCLLLPLHSQLHHHTPDVCMRCAFGAHRYRTSSGAGLRRAEDDVVAAIEARLAAWLNVDVKTAEPLQVSGQPSPARRRRDSNSSSQGMCMLQQAGRQAGQCAEWKGVPPAAAAQVLSYEVGETFVSSEPELPSCLPVSVHAWRLLHNCTAHLCCCAPCFTPCCTSTAEAASRLLLCECASTGCCCVDGSAARAAC